MVKITDVLGAMVEAQLKAAEWEAEFQAQFNGPLKLAAQVQQFLATPPEQRGPMSADTQARMSEHARRMQQQMGGGMIAGTGMGAPMMPAPPSPPGPPPPPRPPIRRRGG